MAHDEPEPTIQAVEAMQDDELDDEDLDAVVGGLLRVYVPPAELGTDARVQELA